MDLKNYVIEKFEKYYFENKKAIDIKKACYLYMDKNNLLEILDDKEFYKINNQNYGLVKWILLDIYNIFNNTGFFEVVNIREIAEKTFGVEIVNIEELLCKLEITNEQWKFSKVDFKELLNKYNIEYKLDLISDDKEEKTIIDELEEELILEKKLIKKLEEKLREQELFKINVELDEIVNLCNEVSKIPLEVKIVKYVAASEKGMCFDELYFNISILENITREELIDEIKKSKVLVENNSGLIVLANKEFSRKDVDMKGLIEIIEKYVKASSSKILKQSWNIFKEYNFTKEEVSLQKIGEKYGYTRDYTFQLHNMSIEVFEYKKIKDYLDIYMENIVGIIEEEKFIRVRSEGYKKIFGQWNTKKFINFINKFGLDLILTDNKYVMSRKLYEEYFFSKKDKSFRNLKKNYIKKCAVN